ncbi:MAG: hypothetical protein OEN50_09745, partial [Deltaproteobacteria bacterium]|nr:hypothetical protein [Deltaproteobacteria bacterium]
GGSEIGLVTAVEEDNGKPRLLVFVPHSPNPAQGRLLSLAPERVTATDWSVDRALKRLFSLGKV